MTGGFKESALRINSYVVKQDTWNENKIIERANELVQKSMDIWMYPDLADEILERYIPEEDNDEYSIDTYEYLTGEILELYDLLDKRIMNISSGVKREFRKLYIAYKAETNFVDIVPQKSRLRLSLNMKFDEVIDIKGIAKDTTDVGRWGNGDVEVGLSNENLLDDVMELIIQSYNKQMGE